MPADVRQLVMSHVDYVEHLNRSLRAHNLCLAAKHFCNLTYFDCFNPLD